MDKRRMCPGCRAFVTSSDRVCPYCDARLGARAVDVRDPGAILGGLISHARFTTVIILLLNAAFYGATWLYETNTGTPELQTLVLFGAKLPFAYMHGQWWRLLAAGFLHGGILHLLMNSWVLYDLGAEVESVYGTSRYVVLYALSTIGGFLLSSVWNQATSIGASAGIFGLIGAMIAYGLTDRTSMGSAVKRVYIRWAVYGLALGFLPIFPVDNAAHIGGLAGGFLIGLLAGTPRVRQWKENLMRGAAIACLALTGYTFLQMFFSLTSAR